jgi:pyruvate decarboxylase
MYNQTIWGSIGYATPASVGSMVAIKEKSGLFGGRYKRGILVTGEGSLQLTVQSFADMLRLGLNPVM